MGGGIVVSIQFSSSDRSKCKRLCDIRPEEQKRAQQLVKEIDKLWEHWGIVSDKSGSGPPLELSASLIKQLGDMGYFVKQEVKVFVDERRIPITKSETTLLTLETLGNELTDLDSK